MFIKIRENRMYKACVPSYGSIRFLFGVDQMVFFRITARRLKAPLMVVGLLFLTNCGSGALGVMELEREQPRRLRDSLEQPVGIPAALSSGESKLLGAEYKVGNPYQIRGIWYYPEENENYSETGIASWYGPNFHGKKTANGAIYDQNQLTAAHKTLPLPSMVRVKNLENGRIVDVIVNDRGPYHPGRIIDLSRGSADLLGVLEKGTARVSVRMLPAESRRLRSVFNRQRIPSSGIAIAPVEQSGQVGQADPQSSSLLRSAHAALPRSTVLPPKPTGKVLHGNPEATKVFVQVGAFSVEHNAKRLQSLLSYIGPVNVERFSQENGPLLHRVRIGPFSTVQTADQALTEAIRAGAANAVIVVGH